MKKINNEFKVKLWKNKRSQKSERGGIKAIKRRRRKTQGK